MNTTTIISFKRSVRKYPLKSRQLILLEDDQFQKAYKHFCDHNDKASWDEMFLLVLDTAQSVIKKRSKNNFIPDLYGKALESTMNCMKRIKKDSITGKPLPKRLATLVWLYTSIMYSPGLQMNERALSYETLLEEKGG